MTGDVTPIWRPDPDVADDSAIARFGRFVADRTGVEFGQYLDLWRWSVDHLPEFWGAVWDFYGLEADGSHAVALADAAMPGARWFPGTRLNYAEHALRHRAGDDDLVAVTAVGEDGTTVGRPGRSSGPRSPRWPIGSAAAGVGRGDRVVGYLPDTTPTLVAFLATASIGAIWSACAQDYGADGAAARFAQLEPVILVAADGYPWNGKVHDRRGEVTALQRALPTLRATVHVTNVGLPSPAEPGTQRRQLGNGDRAAGRAPLRPGRLRRAAVGAVLLRHHRPAQGHRARPRRRPARAPQAPRACTSTPARTARVFWYTSTNWIMWNIVASGLLVGAPIVLYDGSPAYPDAAAPVADRRRPAGRDARGQPRLPAGQRQGGPGAWPRPRPRAGSACSAPPAPR